MLAASRQSGILVALDELGAITRDLLRVIANRSHAKGLVTNISEDVENRPEDPVNADRVQLLACCRRNFLGQFFRPRGCQAHGAWELADVDFIVEAIDASVFLVNRNG